VAVRIPKLRAAAVRSIKRSADGDIAVQNLPSIVADDEETVQNSKSQSRHGEEIHCTDCFAMVAEKSQPAPW
jgi:hypothetical protein